MIAISRDVALDTLKRCFPTADRVEIVRDTLEDGNLHFTSNIGRYTVQYTQDGRIQQKQLVLKVPISEETLEYFESFNCHNREITIYEVVLPKINKYLEKSLAPAHLYATDSKILALEDLTVRGYKSGEKMPLLDLKRTSGVLKALAQFHAASHKLHGEDAHLLENLLRTHVAGIELIGNIVGNWEPVVLELLRRKNETSLIPKVMASMTFLKGADDEIRGLVNQSHFKFVVLNHGDSRKDNLMLKYGSNDEVKVQFLDFQSCLWSSPFVDIIYFLATSVSIDVIEGHYEDLIEGYLHELNERLRKLDCVRTYERLDYEKDFKNLRFFTLASVLCLCCIVSPMDHRQKAETFSQPQTDVTYLYDLCLTNEKFVHSVYGWLKYCEKSEVFECW